MTDLDIELARSKRALRRLEGERAFHIECFGDHLAQRERYKEHDGIDAVHYYLVKKHHWLPSVVKSMSIDDLSFLLKEEMSGWTLPVPVLEMIEAEEKKGKRSKS